MNENPSSPGADTPDQPAPTPPVEEPSATQPAASSTPVEEAQAEESVAAKPPAPPPPASEAPPASAGGNKGLPIGLLAAAAIIPAIIVGAIVYFVAGGGGSSKGGSFAVLDGFVRLSLAQGEQIESYNDQLPEGFPSDLPQYGGADMDGAFAIESPEGTTYIVTYSSSASRSDVYNYYLERLDQEPWQIELAREGDDFTGMQFSRPDSADIQGSISLSYSEVDNRTAIFVFLLDASQTSSASGSSLPLPAISRELPPLFPNDLPIYGQDDGTVITETYFQRDSGQNAFLISFITKDADVDVINFYTKEFQDRGWNVADAPVQAGDFALTIDFDDAAATPEVQGTIRADVYPADASYTEVNLIVQVSARRGRGN